MQTRKNYIKNAVDMKLIADRFFPKLCQQLSFAEFRQSAEEYLAKAILQTLMFTGVLAVIYMVCLFTGLSGLFSSIAVFILPSPLLFFMQKTQLPAMKCRSKVRDIEKNLLRALNYMEIQLKSGVTLYYTIYDVANSDFGLISKIFRDVVKRINKGQSEIHALEDATVNIPSNMFRTCIHQITTSLIVGVELTSVLSDIRRNLCNKQSSEIKEYGAVLKTFVPLNVILCHAFPAAAIVIVVIIFSFMGVSVQPVLLFSLIIAYIFFSNITFLYLFKIKKPNMVGG